MDVVADTILDLDAATVTLTKAGADQVVKHATDTYDLAFQQTDGNEVYNFHNYKASFLSLVSYSQMISGSVAVFL